MPFDPPPLGHVYELSAGSFRAGELHVLSFDGREEMNGLYAFDLVVWGNDIDEGQLESAVLGMPATLAMHIPEGSPRQVRGLVTGITFEGRQEGGRHAFRLHLVPRLWLLGKRVNSRIYQDKTVQEIADAVLDEHSIVRRWNLMATYPARQYCVQYQESDYAFVTRILAEEGIFFWFDQPADGDEHAPEQLVLGDDAQAYPPIDGDPALVYRREIGDGAMRPDENQILDFRARTRVEPTAVVLHDYDFRRPMLDLTGAAPAAMDAAALPPAQAQGRPLEVYDHHGEYEETDADAGHAKVYLEQLRAGAREADARSVCRRLLPGHCFDLADQDIDKLNARWVVALVEHHGVSPESAKQGAKVYENHFHCVPAEIPFRPARPPRVLRQVTESAVVVGPEGQEIYTDGFGRIKVQFHWDREGKRNEKSSCWMRVAQAWAGTGWGFQFIPRIGMEVLVTFLGGDQDRPVVMGCVPNAANPLPFPVQTQVERSGIRTQTTPGGNGSNEISFDDRAAREQLYLHAQRDLDEVAERNHTLLVRGDERLRVLGSRMDIVEEDVIVRVARNVEEHVGGDRTTQVEGNRIDVVTGNSDERVSGMLVTRVEGKERRSVQKNADLEYAEDVTVRVRGCMTTLVGKHDAKRSWATHAEGNAKLSSMVSTEISSEGELLLRVGKSSIRITSEKIEIDSPAVTVKGKGGGLSADDDGLRLSSKGDAQVLVDKKLVLKSKAGASLSMEKEVKIDGEQILLNSPEDAKDPPPKPPEPPTKVVFKDHEGRPLKHQRFLVVTGDGSEVSGMTDKDGKAEVDLKSGGKVTFPDLSKAR